VSLPPASVLEAVEPPGQELAPAAKPQDDATLGICLLLPGEEIEPAAAAKDLPVVHLPIVGPFGNASHPTTRVILRWMASASGSAEISGMHLCDYGCGSGILGIAALRRGAKECTFVDVDLCCLAGTKENGAANGFQLHPYLPPTEVLQHDLDFFSRFGSFSDREDGWAPLPADFVGKFPVVLCNIIVGPLCRVAPTLNSLCAPGGIVVLAGFNGARMRRQVEEAYSPFFTLHDLEGDNDWGCMIGRKA